MRRFAFVTLTLLALGGCREDKAELPAPVLMSAAATGYFCQMIVVDHPGPKAQIHLEGPPAPIFFSQVRDAVAYQRLPEQAYPIKVIYVTDMGAAPSWQDIGAGNWINAKAAQYVVGSDATGGMGTAELVPFADPAAAAAFVAVHGGRVVGFDQITDADVLAPVDLAPVDLAPVDLAPVQVGPPSDAEDAEYLERLRALGAGKEG
ncbi:MAG: nitrous oxide reductase accessory protein NosL [Rhodobacteraceae bacterium]|nr:nitrous oxide reductase accessory protein NosL [Paracoccaceae bacterium]